MNTPAVKDLLDLRGAAAVVTGASAGIGAGIARRFSEAGADIVVHYRGNESGARAVAAEIQKLGRRAVTIKADVSEASGVADLISAAVNAFGAVDVLINNAGSYPASPLIDMAESEFDRVVADNLRSVHLCTQAAARAMINRRRSGSIINIASIEAENPAPKHTHYTAAKAAVVMYTRTAALELGGKGIRVNCVSPGLIWREGLDRNWPEGVNAYKEVVPLARLGTAEDVADACLFLASPAARWITGANLLVDGGVLTNRAY
jgi:NAD(P)-dependent dehydrogenase (short-subunit alcohol dehydrogenase family)